MKQTNNPLFHLLLSLLLCTTIPQAHAQNDLEDWETYRVDSLMYFMMPDTAKIDEQRTESSYVLTFSLVTDSATYMIQKTISPTYFNPERKPKDTTELKTYYEKAARSLAAGMEYGSIINQKHLKEDGYYGYTFLVGDESTGHFMTCKFFLIDDFLYLIYYGSNMQFDQTMSRLYYNRVLFDPDVERSQF